MISYRITIGGVVIIDDLISLRFEHSSKVDGQRLDITLANIDNKYTGAFTIKDEIQVILINEGYTASPYVSDPEMIFQKVYRLCMAFVEYVDYKRHEVVIEAAAVEDDLANDHVEGERTFVAGDRISTIVNWILDQHDPALFPRRIINIKNNVLLESYTVGKAKTNRDELDALANRCNCQWWVEISPTGEHAFYFVDTMEQAGSVVEDLDGILLESSYAFNAVGFCNDVVVIGGGNKEIPAGSPGSEIPDTREITSGPRKRIDGDERDYRCQTIYDFHLRQDSECIKRAENMLTMFEAMRKHVATPVAIGIAPPLLSPVKYFVGDMLVQGVITKKTVEFSADGWICHLEANRLLPIGNAIEGSGETDTDYTPTQPERLREKPEDVTSTLPNARGRWLLFPGTGFFAAMDVPVGARNYYFAAKDEMTRLLKKVPNYRYNDFTSGNADMYYNWDTDTVQVVPRNGDPPKNFSIVHSWNQTLRNNDPEVQLANGWAKWAI